MHTYACLSTLINGHQMLYNLRTLHSTRAHGETQMRPFMYVSLDALSPKEMRRKNKFNHKLQAYVHLLTYTDVCIVTSSCMGSTVNLYGIAFRGEVDGDVQKFKAP